MIRSPLSIEQFLQSLSTGQPVLKTLGVAPGDLHKTSLAVLLESPDDVGRGVTAIEVNFGTVFFGLFSSLVVKHHADGKVRYFLSGTTQDAAAVTRIYRLICGLFGPGTYDEARFAPFSRTDKIVSLSKGQYATTRDTLNQVWLQDEYNFALQYSVSPLHEFTLAVTQKPPTVEDRAIRKKGTVADLLSLDLDSLLHQAEMGKEVCVEEGTVKFIDYRFALDEPALGLFDELHVRLFGPERAFTPDVQTNLTFAASGSLDASQMIRVAEELIRLYGPDHIGLEELQPSEVEELQERKWWMGRMWLFNEQHAPWNPSSPSGKNIYGVSVTYHPTEEGFTLWIAGYEGLIAYFK